MSNREDPIETARECFDVAGRNLKRYEQMTTPVGRQNELAGFEIAMKTAHVAATIALAEEQRTANLLAWFIAGGNTRGEFMSEIADRLGR